MLRKSRLAAESSIFMRLSFGRTWGTSSISLLAGLSTLPTADALAQPYLTYASVPHVATQSPAVFHQLFAGAHSGAVRAIMLGDSQETSPGGQGARYMPRLNYEFFRHYGNVPESVLTTAWGSTGGVPPADWLIRLSSAAPGPGPGRVPSTALPPNLGSAVCSLANGNNVNNNQWLGCLIMLQHDAADTDPGVGLNTGTEYFKRGAGVYLDVYAATNASSGEVVCRVTPAPTHSPNYYRPTLATLTTNLGLQDPIPSFKRQRFGPLSFGGQPYMQVELYGSDPAKLTDIVAAQFIGTVDPGGWSISSLGAGGYRTIDFLGNHPDALDLVQLFSPNVAFIAFGANDGGQGFTPHEFHDNLVDLITAIRARLGATFPIILLSDPWREVSSSLADNYDRYPGVAYAISQELSAVCAINGRRLTEEAGWNASTQAVFLIDSVHYSPAGATLKARLEAQALFDAFDPACVLPAVDQNPFEVATCLAAGASFSVVASADPAPSYQWRRAGSPLSDTPGRIAGATSPTLVLSAVTPADAGPYDCVVTNPCGSVTSAAASLTLFPRCPADLDDGTLTGTPDAGVDISDLLFFLAQYEAGSLAADLDDGSMTGTPDAGVDINDLLFFLAHYESGC